MAVAETVYDAALLLEEARRSFASGHRAQGFDLARATLRTTHPEAATATLGELLVIAGKTGYAPLIAFALRGLRKRRALAPGEARRLFRALDRIWPRATFDRYVDWLARYLPRTNLPLRRILIALWATGRHDLLVDVVRRHRPAKLNDPDTFRFFAEKSIRFGDYSAAVPLFAHLHAIVPLDEEIVLALARGQIERGALAGAARLLAAIDGPGAGEARLLVERLCDAALDALFGDPDAAVVADVREAVATLLATIPDHPMLEQIERMAAVAEHGDRPDRRTVPRAGARKITARELDGAIRDLAVLAARSTEHNLTERAIADFLTDANLSEIAPSLDLLFATAPQFAAQIAGRFMAEEGAAAGVTLFAGLAPDAPSAVWLAAITLAERAEAPDRLTEFAQRVAHAPDAALNDLRAVSDTLAQTGAPGVLDPFWHAAAVHNRDPRAAVAALRALHLLRVSPAFHAIAAGLIDGTLRRDLDSPRLVEAMRVVLARTWKWSDTRALSDVTIDPGLPPAMALWIGVVVAWSRFDHAAALTALDEGVARFGEDAPVSFLAERALLNLRFGHWGAVAADLPSIDRETLARGPYARLAQVTALAAAVPLAHDADYPETLIDAVFDRPPSAPYDPIPRSVVTIMSALASGGSEKQGVSVIEALSREPLVAQQTLLVRNVAPAPLDFFLPQVELSGIPFRVFGDLPNDPAAVLASIGEPAESPLGVALRFLPPRIGDAICQLVPLLRELRPAVVHIRQDFVGAALACVVAGVPRFFLHRGSLSPDHWEIRPPQVIATVRPMRHAYRRLLHHPGFAFINNSAAGLESDRAWTQRTDADRFHLVHNTVDFDRLGAATGVDLERRRTLGIPDTAPVIGAAFRLQRVKRPLLWLGAAKAALARIPDAHFVIVGDGELRAAMAAYAEAEGFGDRLHLPGTVVDVGAWYRAMDLVLLTSDREGLPNMLIEAQHFGVPAISTDVGGAAETMDVGRTGRLLPVDVAPEALGAAVADALEDRAWYDRAHAEAPEYVHERFGATTAVATLIRLYGFASA